MLEHLPDWLGHALRGWRAGGEKLALADPDLATPARIDLSSPAFADGGRLPDRFTADADGHSPPLGWGAPPPGTARLALVVEDADSPTPQPLVHALVGGLSVGPGTLPEGAIAEAAGAEIAVGRNSYGQRAWLPPDPPTGHGDHRYVFQLFALGPDAALPDGDFGRSALVEAMRGHVLAMGLLTGTYSRGDTAEIGPVGAGAIA